MPSYLLELPGDMYILIYKKVFQNTLNELQKIRFNLDYGVYKINFTCVRCNARINGKRCKKTLKTSYLLNNRCVYHINNKTTMKNLIY